MTRRVTSSDLVGRTAELTAAYTAIASVKEGHARIVLLAGDAGMGKTRFISELAGRAERGGLLTAIGDCVQLGEASVAYAPLVAALRSLRQQLGVDTVDELLGSGLAAVGPLFGETSSAVTAVTQDVSRGALFEHLLSFLVRLGARQPTVLVFEDMHWADPSTRDLVAYLSRNLREAGVALLLSYRTDELHRRHPFRTVLVDLERDSRTERILLTGLSRPEIVSLLGRITDAPPTADELDDLVARTAGNPFYLEELVAASHGRGGLPPTVTDAILMRVGELSPATSTVLHQAAVLGQTIDDELLAEVTGTPVAQVADALREAVSRQLLVVDQLGCRFRHALVREALYDDLLPGERERLHAAAARALQRPERPRVDEHVRWTWLAYHADATHDVPLAFVASVRAGIESERQHALADAAGHYDHALQLWDRVPDPHVAAGMPKAELLLRAAKVTQYSSHSLRDVALVESALAALSEDVRPEQRALFLERLGRVNWIHQRGAQAVAAYEQAVALLRDRPASTEQAFTLAALGQSLALRAHFREAETVLRRAIAVSQAVGAGATEGHALCSLSAALVMLGRVTEGLAEIERAHVLSRDHGTTDDVCRCYNNHVHNLNLSGRYGDAQQLAVDGIDYAASTGHLHHYGDAITGNRIMALYLAGRWQEAAAVKAAFELRVSEPDPHLETHWVNVLFGQGRYDEAKRVLDRLRDATVDADDVQLGAVVLMRAGELAALTGRWEEARQLLARGLTIAAGTDDQYYSSRGYAVALQVEADRIEAGGVVDHASASIHQIADRLIDQARQLAAVPDALLLATRAWLATAEAQYLRVRGGDDGPVWASVAAEWDRVGQPFPAAYARYRQADALVRHHGDRRAAAAAARDARDVAEVLAAAPLAVAIEQLAQRARLDLAPDPVDGMVQRRGPHLNVTPREAEVLEQLAMGRTNRQIAETLFISEKTASVHVTNLLRKLGVSSRVEAAAIAQRAGRSDN